MNFNISFLHSIINSILKGTYIFIGSQLGLDFLSIQQKDFLQSMGVNLENLKTGVSDYEKSFLFGIFAAQLGGKKSFTKKEKEFEEWIMDNKIEDLSLKKIATLNHLKNRTFNDINGLGNRVAHNYNNRIISASSALQAQLQRKIKEKTIEAVKANQTVTQLASDLREMTGDWGRDFDRISYYVMQEAYAYGRVAEFIDTYGEDVEVYKQTFPGVCDSCRKLYGNPGEKPVVYKLSELLANGDNIGRKVFVPVVGPAHPWARSILHVIPPNSVWDDKKKRFVIKRNDRGVKRKNKVKINIEI